MAILSAWQRPSRVIPTDIGNGSDGVLTISSNTTEDPIAASCSGVAGSTLLSATNASFAQGQIVLIHQTRGTGVGQWEINKIASYTAGTITLSTPLQYTYTDSGNSQAQVRVLKQYSSVTVNSGITYTAKAWNGDVGGIIGWLCSGTTTIAGTVLGTGRGYIGGWFDITNSIGQQGEGTVGAGGGHSRSANGTGGGGGDDKVTDRPGGGGGGGHAAPGTNGANGTAGAQGGAGGGSGGSADLTTLILGGAGGSGGDQNDGSWHYGGIGGNSGAIVVIFTKKLTITGAITNSGEAGGNGQTKAGGGGGGSGGSILLVGDTITLGTSLVTATKGAGGAGNSGAGNGGAGADGRIAVYYKTSVSGTTNPTYYTQQDATLKFVSASGSNFIAFLNV